MKAKNQDRLENIRKGFLRTLRKFEGFKNRSGDFQSGWQCKQTWLTSSHNHMKITPKL